MKGEVLNVKCEVGMVRERMSLGALKSLFSKGKRKDIPPIQGLRIICGYCTRACDPGCYITPIQGYINVGIVRLCFNREGAALHSAKKECRIVFLQNNNTSVTPAW